MLSYSFIFYILQIITSSFSLQEGDLLFQDSDCGSFCDAIEKVTQGYQGANLSHVGMVICIEDNILQVIEATTNGVVLTSIDTFLNRSFDVNGNSKVIVGRMKEKYRSLIPAAVAHSKNLLGKTYDYVFDITNDTYYCSELVHDAYKKANGGEAIFKLYPMTFIDPDTQKTFGIWTDYYNELGEVIPEGAPGLNPGGISRSPYIEIVHKYGIPSGMQ